MLWPMSCPFLFRSLDSRKIPIFQSVWLLVRELKTTFQASEQSSKADQKKLERDVTTCQEVAVYHGRRLAEMETGQEKLKKSFEELVTRFEKRAAELDKKLEEAISSRGNEDQQSLQKVLEEVEKLKRTVEQSMQGASEAGRTSASEATSER